MNHQTRVILQVMMRKIYIDSEHFDNRANHEGLNGAENVTIVKIKINFKGITTPYFGPRTSLMTLHDQINLKYNSCTHFLPTKVRFVIP